MEKKTWVCDWCAKKFCAKQKLQYHIDHKVCQKVSKHICITCGYIFTRKEQLQYHIEHDVCVKKQRLTLRIQKPHIDVTPVCSIEQLLTHSKEELAQQLICLQQREQLKDTEIRVLKENPKTVINIVNFGKEDQAEIQKKCPNLLTNAMKYVSQSIPYITKQIHCNPEVFPQYENIYLDSFKAPFAMVYSDGQFHRQSTAEAIDNLIEEGIHLLQDHVDGIEDEKIIRKYETYRDSVESEDAPRRKELEHEIIGILLDQGDRIKLDNRSKMILKNYMTRT
jgi:hypothetical protein